MSTIVSRLYRLRNRNMLQSYILLGLGVIFLLGALLLRLNFRVYPVGLFLFGLGLLVAAAVNPTRLVIAGLFFTFVGAAFFLGLKQLLPFDNALLIIAISLALLGIALMARKGYIAAGDFCLPGGSHPISANRNSPCACSFYPFTLVPRYRTARNRTRVLVLEYPQGMTNGGQTVPGKPRSFL